MVPVKEAFSFSTRATGYQVEMTKLKDGSYRFFLYSMDNVPITPGDSPVISLIYNNKVGHDSFYNTTVLADQIILSTPEERNGTSSPSATWHIGGVLSGLLGDANNDGQITVADITCIIDFLLEIDTSRFTESQADMNQDQRITITDVVEVIHAIFQQ
jgi:hypothetical protein